MKKIMLALFTAVALLPACCIDHVRHPEAGMNLPEALEHRTVALVRWVVPDEDGNAVEVDSSAEKARLTPFCGGVWISDTMILTAQHCVRDIGKSADRLKAEALEETPPGFNFDLPKWNPVGRSIQYSNFVDVNDNAGHFSFRASHPALVAAIDVVHDLALVKAAPDAMDQDIIEHVNARLATDVHVGDNVNIVGHPSGMWWTYVHGAIAAVRPNVKRINAVDAHTDLLQISAPVWFGNSGGGAWSDSGELLGICSSLHARAPNMSFFIQYTTVSDFLSLNGVK